MVAGWQSEIREPNSSQLSPAQKSRAALLLPRWIASNSSLRGEISPPSPPPQTGVIFQTNWSEDTGYVGTSLAPGTSEGLVPTGWDRGVTTATGSFRVVPGGEDGPNVMRVNYSHIFNNAMSLYKHLTRDKDTGFSELYIRYKFRFPWNTIFGKSDLNTNRKIDYWKWVRLWQNGGWPYAGAGQPGQWTENRPDSYFCVVNFSGGEQYGIAHQSAWSAAELVPEATNLSQGSAGGPHLKTNPWLSGTTLAPYTDDTGFWQSIGNGDLDINWQTGRLATYPSQVSDWHTVQMRFKCATELGANDGIFAAWYDGVEQVGMNRRLIPNYGCPPVNGIPTTANPGFNVFAFLDNYGNWFKRWDPADATVSSYVEFDSVVISTEFIQDNYVVG